jgi:hypothetical protein
MAKQDDWVRMQLRLPRDLHAALTARAKEKSLNAVIIEMLEVARGAVEALEAAAPGRFEAESALRRGQIYGDALAQREAWRRDYNARNIVLQLRSATPISWAEINEHAKGLGADLPKGLQSLRIEVLTPDVLESDGRRDEANAIAEAYLGVVLRGD